MAMSWGPLRRWIHPQEQAPITEPDEHGLRPSEDLREHQKLRQALDAERDRAARNDGKRTLGYMSGPRG
jgi:hypothetical protein